MGLNDKVSAERVHIGFFGLRNAGKSSVVKCCDRPEPIPCLRDQGNHHRPGTEGHGASAHRPGSHHRHPGIDDVGTLGEMRVKRALQVLDKTDIAILVVDAEKGLQPADQELLKLFEEKENSAYYRIQQIRPALRSTCPAGT